MEKDRLEKLAKLLREKGVEQKIIQEVLGGKVPLPTDKKPSAFQEWWSKEMKKVQNDGGENPALLLEAAGLMFMGMFTDLFTDHPADEFYKH